MDPVSAIAGAIIAGATAAVKDTASQAIKDSYNALKNLIVSDYKITSVATVEKNPSSPAYQEGLKQEIQETPKLADDVNVLAKAKEIIDAIKKEPFDKLEGWGLHVDNIKAYSDVIIERISGVSGGARAGSITSEAGGIIISDVHAGKPSGN